MTISDNTLALAPWSATKQKTATTCPFRAYHLYVAKEKEKFDEPPNTSAMTVGIKIHYLMELVLKTHPAVFPEYSNLAKMGNSILEKKVIADGKDLSLQEIDHIYSLYDGTLNMCQRILSHRSKTKSIGLTEVPVGVDNNFNPVDFFDDAAFYRGKIDYLLLHPTGSAAIIDAKTGAWPHLKSHAPQLRAYEILTLYSLKKHIQDAYNITLTSVISGLAYVATEQLLWDDKQTVNAISTGKENLISTLNKVSDRVFNKEIKRGNHCIQCGYKHLCGSRRGKGRGKTKS